MPSPSDVWSEHLPAVTGLLLDDSAQLNVLVEPRPPHLIVAARGPAQPVLGCELSRVVGLTLESLEPKDGSPGLLPFSSSFIDEPGSYGEVAILRGDGTPGVVAMRVATLPGEGALVLLQLSEVGHFVKLSAELRQMHQQLRAAHQQLLDQGKALDEARRAASLSLFAAGLAHELNNPLAILLSNAQTMPSYLEDLKASLAGKGDGELSELRSMVDEIQGVCRRMSSTVKMLSELEQRPQRQKLEVVALVKSLSGEFEPLDVLGEPIEVDTDAGLYRRLLLPVLDNARKAMTAVEPVKVFVTASPKWVRVEIDDSGPGVSPELGDRVFDPFFTTRPPGSGLGLGLFLARRAAAMLGGELSHQPNPSGKGTRFVAELPLTMPEQHDLHLNYEQVRTRK